MSFQDVIAGKSTWYIECSDVLDGLRLLPDGVVHTCITSPPYFSLRDYGCEGQIGLESSPDEYVEKLAEVFREVRRVLVPSGVVFLNLGDSYSSGNREGHGNVVSTKQRTNNHAAFVSRPKMSSGRYRLRKDLKPEQVAYVLSELYRAAVISFSTDDGSL